MHRTDDQLIDVRHSRYMAERIPGARYVELPGEDHLPSVGDTEAVHRRDRGVPHRRAPRRAPDRELLTVLFTDIVDGTARAAELGDARWRDLLAAHDAEVRRQLVRFGGREVKTIGDGFLAVFDGPPSRRSAARARSSRRPRELGVDVRAGLHTGECEVIGDDVGGMAVHIAARVCALARPRRGARVGHDVRDRRRLGDAVRGPGLARPQGRARRRGRSSALRLAAQAAGRAPRARPRVPGQQLGQSATPP